MKRPFLPVVVGVCLLITACGGSSSPPPGPPLPAGFGACQGDRFNVDLLDALEALPDDVPAAHLEQLRDWVWTTLLARLAARDGSTALLASIARQPLLRDEGLAHLLEMQVGRSRSTSARDGAAVVLVEHSSPHRAYGDLLEAIDHEAMLSGGTPSGVEVYGVRFRLETAEAEVCRLGSFTREWIEAPERGYRQQRIATQQELAGFLAGGVDLLAASCTADGGLEVAGRVRERTASAPMTLEDVAALNQQPRYLPLDRLPAASDLAPEMRAQARAFAAQLDRALAQAEAADAPLPMVGENADAQRLLDIVVSWKRAHPRAATEELLLSAQLQIGASESMGFSLDPHTDVREALELLDRLAAAPRGAAGLSPVLRAWEVPAAEALRLAVNLTAGGSSASSRASLLHLRDEVRKADEHTAEGMLLAAERWPGDPLTADLVQQVLRRARYQRARYDGPLTGTAPAMTMFYADLVAKLWALDWHGSAPTGVVPGFVSVPEHRESVLSCQGDESVPHTRIWLGTKREGFVRNAEAALRFAPTATRLFVRGSALGAEHSEEVEPSLDMLRFIRFWDRHYAEVAEWEPQYERLNQIVKWTLVRRLAEVAEAPACLAFLDGVEVERRHRFDRWLDDQEDLRWSGPVPLLKRPGEATECLPLLESERFERCATPMTLSGGVSLPSRDDVERATRRFGVDRFEPTARQQEHFEVTTSPTAVRAEADLVSDTMVRATTYVWPARRRRVRYRKEIELRQGGQSAVGSQAYDAFGVARFEAAPLQGDTIHLHVRAGEDVEARELAAEISERMGLDASDLQTATRATAGVLPTSTLPDGRTAVRLSPEERSDAVYSVMSSGDGIRGPPDRFQVEAHQPEGLPHERRPGAIDVWLLSELPHGATPVLERDPDVLAVREHLGQDDFTAAVNAVASESASSRSISLVAAEAARRDQLDVLERSLDRLYEREPNRADLRQVERAIARKRIELARGTGDQQQRLRIDRAQLALAIFNGRLSVVAQHRESFGTAEAHPQIRYHAKLLLPAITHGPGAPARASEASVDAHEKTVTALVSIALRPIEAPRSLSIGNVVLQLVEPAPVPSASTSATTASGALPPPQPTEAGPPFPLPPLTDQTEDEGGEDDDDDRRSGADGAGSPGGAGANDRLLPVLVVLPCRTSGTVENGPTAHWLPVCIDDSDANEDAAWRASVALLACDLDGDGHIDDSTAEQQCVQLALQKHEPALRPHIAR